MKHKKGFMLPFVIALATILMLLAFTRHFFSRQHLKFAGHVSDNERSYHISSGALLIAQNLFEQIRQLYNDPDFRRGVTDTPEHLEEILDRLLDENLVFGDSEIIVNVPSHFFADLTRDVKGFQSLNVSFHLVPIEPLFDNSSSNGFIMSDKERVYNFFINSRAYVGNSNCWLSSYKRIKQINILPPVLGKFVLFVKDQQTADLNRIYDTRSPPEVEELPLVVYSGNILDNKLESGEARAFLDAQGWIFMGGSRKWSLGLGAGGDNAYHMMPEGICFYAVDTGSILDQHGAFSFYSQPAPLSRQLRGASFNEAFKLFADDTVTHSSILRFTGCSNEPTPTVVLGNVARTWALLQGIRNDTTGQQVSLPYLSDSDFFSNTWPDNPSQRSITLLREHFNYSYNEYRARMSSVVSEDYNAGLLSIIDYEPDPLDNSLLVDPDYMPLGLIPPPPLQRLISDNQNALFYTNLYSSSYTMKKDNSDTLFENSHFENISNLDFLKNRVTLVLDNSEDFYQELSDDVSNNILIDRAVFLNSSLTIDRYTEIESGGMIIVDGNIDINNSIVSRNSTLTLISLNGGININTSQLVQASLIAINNNINLSREATIKGNVVANRVQIESGTPLSERTIKYDKRLDITSTFKSKIGYRLAQDGEEITFVR